MAVACVRGGLGVDRHAREIACAAVTAAVSRVREETASRAREFGYMQPQRHVFFFRNF